MEGILAQIFSLTFNPDWRETISTYYSVSLLSSYVSVCRWNFLENWSQQGSLRSLYILFEYHEWFALWIILQIQFHIFWVLYRKMRHPWRIRLFSCIFLLLLCFLSSVSVNEKKGERWFNITEVNDVDRLDKKEYSCVYYIVPIREKSIVVLCYLLLILKAK